jgi:predicted ATP-grasp superfamily ATP-dependent carboligase
MMNIFWSRALGEWLSTNCWGLSSDSSRPSTRLMMREDAVVVGDHEDGAAFFLSLVLHQPHYVAARLFVEGGDGFVGEN